MPLSYAIPLDYFSDSKCRQQMNAARSMPSMPSLRCPRATIGGCCLIFGSHAGNVGLFVLGGISLNRSSKNTSTR